MNDMNNRQPQHSQRSTPKPVSPATKTIEIKLSLPVVRNHPKLRWASQFVRQKLSRKRNRVLLAVALVVVIALGIGIATANRQKDLAMQAESGPQNPLDQLKQGTPKFTTLLPSGKSVDELGGWTRVSPEDRDPVYAYTDVIDSIPISVSQQPLPASFKENPESSVRSLALSNYATKQLDINGGTVYVGTSTKGPQSVIFREGDTLVLIKANTLIDDKKWQQYIQSLN